MNIKIKVLSVSDFFLRSNISHSALFILYFFYRTDVNIAQKFKNVQEQSAYLTFAKTFEIVEAEGWNAARIYYLPEFNVLKKYVRLFRCTNAYFH